MAINFNFQSALKEVLFLFETPKDKRVVLGF